MNRVRTSALLGRAAVVISMVMLHASAQAQQGGKPEATAAAASPEASPAAKPTLDIMEFDVDGNTVLDEISIDRAVEPYLGPGRSFEDVDAARGALEELYHNRGYKTVAVEIPRQNVRDGAVMLKVHESGVGHLNVVGSKYHSIDEIKSEAPSVAEGRVPNFNELQHDLVALNSQGDRRVTPALKAGATPGTVDIDLVVDDHLPVHGSAELNNAHSQDTTVLRTIGTLSYDNLWQLGHSLSLSYQTAPEDQRNARVLFGSYLMRFGDSPFSLLFNGLRNDSNVAAVGTTDVVGNGTTYGVRGIFQLPAAQDLYPTLSIGVDRKHINTLVTLPGTTSGGDNVIFTPVEYYPFSITYSALQRGNGITNQLDLSVGFAMPRLGSDTDTIRVNRSNARGQQHWFRENYSTTLEFSDWQTMVRLNGQLTDQPLISSEQFSVGGANSVRGYLESEALGDYGISGMLEERTPSLGGWISPHVDELRLLAFLDGAEARLRSVPSGSDQKRHFSLLSAGLGLNLKLYQYFNGTIDWAEPFFSQTSTKAWDSRVLFRVWTNF